MQNTAGHQAFDKLVRIGMSSIKFCQETSNPKLIFCRAMTKFILENIDGFTKLEAEIVSVTVYAECMLIVAEETPTKQANG